jgi:hypothetical protein
MINPNRLPKLKPRLVPKNLSQEDRAIIAEAELQRKAQEESKLLLQKWANSNKNFNIDLFIKKWNALRKKYKNRFLNLMVEAMSIANGAADANETILHGFNMEQAAIRMDLLTPILEKIITIQVTSMVTQDSKYLSSKQKHNLIERAIAKEFPTKDNIIKPVEKIVQAPLSIPQRSNYVPHAYSPKRPSKVGNKITNSGNTL